MNALSFATPLNPKNPATSAMMRKMTTQLNNIVDPYLFMKKMMTVVKLSKREIVFVDFHTNI